MTKVKTNARNQRKTRKAERNLKSFSKMGREQKDIKRATTLINDQINAAQEKYALKSKIKLRQRGIWEFWSMTYILNKLKNSAKDTTKIAAKDGQ